MQWIYPVNSAHIERQSDVYCPYVTETVYLVILPRTAVLGEDPWIRPRTMRMSTHPGFYRAMQYRGLTKHRVDRVGHVDRVDL